MGSGGREEDNTGTQHKKDLLGEAISGLDEEAKRREHKSSRQPMIESAKRALEMRRSNEAKTAHPEPTSAPKPGKTNPEKAQIARRAPKNPAKVGAISQHTKNMQAKRDGK